MRARKPASAILHAYLMANPLATLELTPGETHGGDTHWCARIRGTDAQGMPARAMRYGSTPEAAIASLVADFYAEAP